VQIWLSSCRVAAVVGLGKEGRWCTNGREEGLGAREEEEATCSFGGGVRALGGEGWGGVGGGVEEGFQSWGSTGMRMCLTIKVGLKMHTDCEGSKDYKKLPRSLTSHARGGPS
jgi:hypothetical protein